MLESVKRWRAVCACGPRSPRKSSRYCGELPALQAPASSNALAKVYEASSYHPRVSRLCHLTCNELYQGSDRWAPTVIWDHCGYGRFAATLPSTPNSDWIREESARRGLRRLSM